MIELVWSAWDRIRRRLIDPDRLVRRVLAVLLVATLATVIGGVFLSIRLDVSTSSSSLPYLRPVLNLTTSVWFYVGVLAYSLRRFLIFRDRRYATQAAEKTGYDKRSILREKYEATSADGATRVLVSDEDAPEEIAARIDRAIETGEDDEIELNPVAFEVDDVDDRYPDSHAAALDEYHDLEERRDEIKAEIDDRLDEVLEADLDPGKVAEFLDRGDDHAAPIDLLADEGIEGVEEIEDRVDELERITERQEEILDEINEDVDDQELEVVDDIDPVQPGRSLRERARGAVDGVKGVLWRGILPTLADRLRGGRDDVDDLDQEASDDVDDEELADPWLERYKTARLDLQTTIDFEEIIWYAVAPAGVAIAGLLLIVGIWVPPYLYPPIVAGGALVGVLNYLRIKAVRTRRLEDLREDREEVSFSELSLLIKTVEIPERTTYHAFMVGRSYAHDDREEFCEEVAFRAYEEVNGIPVSPSVLEKQSRQLSTLKPDLHGFRDAERERIMTWLEDAVRDAKDGLIPKTKLIEDCIEHDRGSRGIGPLSVETGKGYDPDYVRECYRDLVPAMFVEEEIEIDDVDDVDQEGASITAVRLRRDPLPPEYAEIRAKFSSQFGNYARTESIYELPDVSDRLEEEPIFAGRVGAGGGA